MNYRLPSFFFRSSQDNLIQLIKQIKEPICSQANKISERLSQFVKDFVDNRIIDFNQLDDWTYDIQTHSQSPICSKLMNETENYSAFKCYDCMESKSSCICAACFAEGNHKGHNYVQYQAMNGCCDCGNDEAWNQKGFCKHHGKQDLKVPKISPEVQRQYIQEMSLLFIIYIHLATNQKGSSYRNQFGSGLFQNLINFCQQSYQIKYMTYKLLCSPRSLSLGNHRQYQQSKDTILHRIFLLQPSEELEKFVQLSFQIFPVREFRIAVIKEYFEKVNRQNEDFTCQHPLASMNFQFLTCVKLINEMITNKQIKPLALHQYSSYQSNIDFPQVFKKYYEDLDYINYMKSSRQYHILHLSHRNICDLCFYRKFTTFKQSQLTFNQSQIMKYRIDETFLKHFSFMVKNIRQEKKIIQKCLKELFEFIANAGINLVSLVHERSFALLTFAYFDGDIYQLKQKQVSNNFVNLFKSNISNTSSIQQIFQNIITTSLITKINIEQKSDVEMQYNQHQRYFFSCNPEKNFNQFLDIGFHKIILLISQQQGWRYDLFIYNTLIKIQTVIKSAEEKFHQKQREQDQEFKEKFLMAAYKKLYILLNFLNSMTIVNIDESLISKYVGVIQQENIFHFFRRILATFNSINVKQFKSLTIIIINEEETLQKFIRNQCLVEKGKIKSLKEAKPLETVIYSQIFKNYKKNLSKEPFIFLNRQMKNKSLLNDNIFSSQTIHLISQINMNFLFRFSGFENYHLCSELFSKIAFQLIIIYLEVTLDVEKYFFQALLQTGCRSIISKELFEQIIKIQKEGQPQVDKFKSKSKQQLLEQKKKEKLLAKKKQIETTMKKNQKKMLDNYDNSPTKNYSEQICEECIYCKSTQEDNLNYISFIGLTNFYENKIPSYSNGYHVYFQSCGHKIHSSCFENVMMKRKSNYCFLCKRETNILIPQLSKKNADPLSTTKMLEIISTFQAAVISLREQLGTEIREDDIFLNCQNASFQEQLVQGICRDFMFLGLKDYEMYKRTKLLIHYQLFLLLRYNAKNELISIFDKIKVKQMDRFSQIQSIVQNYFKQILLAQNLKSIRNIHAKSPQQQLILNFFSNFLSQKRQQLPTSNLIDIKDLFFQLPQTLNMLNNEIGQCKQCSYLTSFIYICLKCGWSSCRKCLNKIFKHSTYDHLDGSIFISCSAGAVKFFHGNNIYEDDSIYQNYLGQPFNEVMTSQSMKVEKFYLSKQKLGHLKAMCSEYGIHQKIFLNDS